ncbi:MAG TPA: hypothetical protein VN704_11990, partial [Verrucomicrobiae bacterium]|nr:hypothetical protein [Verrucomicrobiae bacterium]
MKISLFIRNKRLINVNLPHLKSRSNMRISPHQGLENINIINTIKIVLPILIVFGTLVVFLPYIKHVPTYAQ